MQSEECAVCASDKRRKLYRYGLGSFCAHTSSEVWWVAEGRESLERRKRFKCVVCRRGYIHISASDGPYWKPFSSYCSDGCEKTFHAQRARERRARIAVAQSEPESKPETECEQCGAKFVARRKAKYCSLKCRAAARRG